MCQHSSGILLYFYDGEATPAATAIKKEAAYFYIQEKYLYLYLWCALLSTLPVLPGSAAALLPASAA